MSRLPIIFAGLLLALCAGAWAAVLAGAAPPDAPSLAPPLPAPTSSRKLDEYSDISFKDEKERLDNFAIELQNDPWADAVLVAYAGRRARAGEARRRLERARRYLVFKRGIKSDRVVLLDGGHREEFTVELWALPHGVTPYLSPTVDPAEAVVIPEEPAPKRPAPKPRRRN